MTTGANVNEPCQTAICESGLYCDPQQKTCSPAITVGNSCYHNGTQAFLLCEDGAYCGSDGQGGDLPIARTRWRQMPQRVHVGFVTMYRRVLFWS